MTKRLRDEQRADSGGQRITFTQLKRHFIKRQCWKYNISTRRKGNVVIVVDGTDGLDRAAPDVCNRFIIKCKIHSASL